MSLPFTREPSNISYRLEPGRPTQNTYVESFNGRLRWSRRSPSRSLARLTSVATFVEIPIVIELRHGAEGLRDLDHFIGRAGIELVPVDAEHGKLACSAFSRFEKDGIGQA